MMVNMTSHITDKGIFKDVSLLPMENIFHPFSNINGEEDVCKIITTSPRTIVHDVPTREEFAFFSKFWAIIKRIERD